MPTDHDVDRHIEVSLASRLQALEALMPLRRRRVHVRDAITVVRQTSRPAQIRGPEATQ